MTTVRSSNLNAAATGTALSVTAPTGTTVGDVVICTISTNAAAASNNVSDNNGATPFTQDLTNFQYGAGAGGGTFNVFSRRIKVGDPGTYNFTASESNRWTVIAVTFKNPNPGAIYDVAPSSGNTNNVITSLTTVNAPSITTLTPNAIHCAVAFNDGSLNVFTSTPSGYTVEQSGGNQGEVFTDKVIVTPGATGTQTFNWTTASVGGATSFAVKDIGTHVFGYIMG